MGPHGIGNRRSSADTSGHGRGVEAIRVLRMARSSAINARTQVANQLRDLLITGPEQLHAQLWPLSTTKRVAHLAATPPRGRC